MTGNSSSSIRFRPELEGLRGLMVLLVIVFHAEVAAFEGGYFAVDIFFVLSGYLMGLIIQADIKSGRFSVVQFYERRARRIMPMLYVVLAVGMIYGYSVLPAAEYESLAESALWILGFAGNIFFASSSSGYFDAGMELQPFMHLWTLGLEQQYYLIIPLCFVVFRLLPKYRYANIHTLLLCMLALSFGAALWGVQKNVQQTFYLPMSRMWEFAAGSLLALNVERLRSLVPSAGHRWVADGGALLTAVVFASGSMHWLHPGAITAVPVLGGLCFIAFANEQSVMSRLLSLRPMVLVGTISYSLYLWHQLFFAFGRWQSVNALSGYDYFALTVGAVVLSVVTYQLVEKPFRRAAIVPTKVFWRGLLVSTLPLYYVADYVDRKDGVDTRLPEVVRAYYQPSYLIDSSRRADGVACYEVLEKEPCRIGSPEADPEWLLVGDSHAASISGALDEAFRTSTLGGYAIFQNACALALGSGLVGDYKNSCEQHNARIMTRALQNDIEGVIVIGRYPYFLDRGGYDNGRGGVETGRQWWYELTQQTAATNESQEALIIETFLRPLEALLKAGKKVVLVYPLPEMGWHVPHYQFKQLLKTGEMGDIAIDLSRYRERIGSVAQAFDSLGERENLVRIRPEEIFCDEVDERCVANQSTNLLYLDDDHLNPRGASILVANIMAKTFGDTSLTNRIVTRF